LAVIIHLFITNGFKEKVILEDTFELPDSLTSKTTTTRNFELDKWKSNLQFEMYAPVDNSWLDMEMTLVNVKTGEEYTINQGVEYYHGYDDGESWSEGDNREVFYLSSIPAGTYFLQLTSSWESITKAKYFQLRVAYDVPMQKTPGLLFYLLQVLPHWRVFTIIILKENAGVAAIIHHIIMNHETTKYIQR